MIENGYNNYKKSVLLASVVFALIAIAIGVYYVTSEKPVPFCRTQSLLSYWPVSLDDSNITSGKLETVKKVFDRLGYREVNGSHEKWDVLWSVEFPFDRFSERVYGMKQYQAVNHFPGMTFLTNKMYMSISTHSKYIPIAFEFPKLKNEFLYYFKTFPSKRFVVKNIDSEGVKIVNFDDMDFFMGRGRYIQEFVENPLLIDGKTFDIGIYVLITSLDPLRIYRYKRDVLLRFCPEPYYPFDPENVDKYFVSKSHLNSWEIPSLKTLIDSYGFSTLDSFQQYLLKNGHDVEKLWEQVDDAIVKTILSKVVPISRYVAMFEMSSLGRKRNLFELLRFDFMIDKEMQIHLMEINMSPSLKTTTKKNQEKLDVTFEQLIYNTLLTVGVAHPNDLKPNNIAELSMLSHSKDINVSPEDCVRSEKSCDDLNLCLLCLTNDNRENLHQAYREHQRRGEMRRIFPTEIHFNEESMKTLSNSTKLLTKWFKLKCEIDYDWC